MKQSILNFGYRIRFYLVTMFKDISLRELSNDTESDTSINQLDWEKDEPWPKVNMNGVMRPLNNKYLVKWHSGYLELLASALHGGSCVINKFRHGYENISATIRFSPTKNAWGAFWSLVDGRSSILPEFDIEHFGTCKHKISVSVHTGTNYSSSDYKLVSIPIRGGYWFNPTIDYYKYEIITEPGFVCFKVGGLLVYKRSVYNPYMRKALLSCYDRGVNVGVKPMEVIYYNQ